MDLAKEKNFFETRVTEYQSAGSLRLGLTQHEVHIFTEGSL